MFKTVIIIVAIVIIILACIFVPSMIYRSSINHTIADMGGKVIKITYYPTIIGTPFVIHPKGSYIYKVTYTINNMNKEAWVRKNLFNSKWIWK
jgi:flagellar basal body-associated protein FliL